MSKFLGLLLLLAILLTTAVKTAPISGVPQLSTPAPVTEDAIPTAEIEVQAGYYLQRDEDGEIEMIQVDDFETYTTTIISSPEKGDNTLFNKLFGEEVQLFCGNECLGLYAAQGDAKRFYEWQKTMKMYVLRGDGSYAELAFNAPAPPECYILGVHFEPGNTLYIHILDYDKIEKMSVWQISEDGSDVLEVDELPYVEENWTFNSYSFASENVNDSYAAMIGDGDIAIFDPSDVIIKRVHPCVVG